MRTKKMAMIIITAVLLSAGSTPSYAIFCSNCSNFVQQILDEITRVSQLSELMSQTEQAIQQTEQQIQMVQNMLQNTAQLPAAINGLTQLAELTAQLNVQRGDLTSLAQIFNTDYPDQSAFLNIADASPANIQTANQQLQTFQDNWSKSVDTASQATFQLTGKQLADLQDSGQLQDHINQLLSTPDGQMQAIEAGNQLAAIQIQEARALRELADTNGS